MKQKMKSDQIKMGDGRKRFSVAKGRNSEGTHVDCKFNSGILSCLYISFSFSLFWVSVLVTEKPVGFQFQFFVTEKPIG